MPRRSRPSGWRSRKSGWRPEPDAAIVQPNGRAGDARSGVMRAMRVGLAAACALCITFAAPVRAQDFPKHPITMIVPFAAGGTSDVIARAVAEQMGVALGQNII